QLYVINIVEDAVGVEDLVELRLLGMLNIHYHDTLFASGNISVGTAHIHIASIGHRNRCAFDRAGAIEMSNVQDFKPELVHDKGVAELDREAARLSQKRRADLRHQGGLDRIVKAHHRQASI